MKYQDIKIGDVAELTHYLTSKDVQKFVNLTGDDNRLHTDFNFAAETSLKRPVVHGMLGASFISTIIGTKLPGDGALWYSQSLEFLLPVREGDTITVRAEVINKDDRSNSIELSTQIFNQYRQLVTQGLAKVKLIEQNRENLHIEAAPRAKLALVVGASGGIGSSVSLALADAGFDVALHFYNNEERARELAQKIEGKGKRSCIFRCDIADGMAVDSMISDVKHRLGGLTVLINCSTTKIAAIKISDLTWKDFELHLNNQIRGTFNLVQAVRPYMESEGYGKIVNIDTQYVDDPAANLSPYITAKSALRGFCRSLAFDLAPKGIRVNSVSPGMTDTDQIADVPSRTRMIVAATTPLRRLVSPKDVAQAIVFLASEQSDFLCGETIRINGGQVMI
jgi:3-oxoacyl-[acyl-carrier protein] reductase